MLFSPGCGCCDNKYICYISFGLCGQTLNFSPPTGYVKIYDENNVLVYDGHSGPSGYYNSGSNLGIPYAYVSWNTAPALRFVPKKFGKYRLEITQIDQGGPVYYSNISIPPQLAGPAIAKDGLPTVRYDESVKTYEINLTKENLVTGGVSTQPHWTFDYPSVVIDFYGMIQATVIKSYNYIILFDPNFGKCYLDLQITPFTIGSGASYLEPYQVESDSYTVSNISSFFGTNLILQIEGRFPSSNISTNLGIFKTICDRYNYQDDPKALYVPAGVGSGYVIFIYPNSNNYCSKTPAYDPNAGPYIGCNITRIVCTQSHKDYGFNGNVNFGSFTPCQHLFYEQYPTIAAYLITSDGTFGPIPPATPDNTKNPYNYSCNPFS